MTDESQLSSNFASDTYIFQVAIGQKISSLIMTFTLIGAAFLFSFLTGWLLALASMAMIPAMIIAGLIFAKILSTQDKRKM